MEKKLKDAKKKLGLYNDGLIVLKALVDMPQTEVSRVKLLAHINSTITGGLAEHRFNDVWPILKKINLLEIRREASLLIRKKYNFTLRPAAAGLSKVLGISQREKSLIFMSCFSKEAEKGLVNVKSLERALAEYNFNLTAKEVWSVQGLLREEVDKMITLRKRSFEKIEFINPNGVGYSEIFEKLAGDKKKAVKPKTSKKVTIVPEEEATETEKPTKEISVVTPDEIMAIINAIEVIYRHTGREANIEALPKLIESWSYMIIPEFRVKDIIDVVASEMPGEIVREGDVVCLGDYQALKRRYFQGTPWDIVVSSESLTLEELSKILRPESIKSSGQYKGIYIHNLKINRDFKGIQEGMNLLKILRSADYVDNQGFVREMKEKLLVEASHQSKTREIYESL